MTINGGLESVKSIDPQILHGEKDEEFEKRSALQREIIDNLPEDIIGEMKKKGGGLAGSLFEILAEQQHKLELAKSGEKEPTEIENDLLEFLKITCAELKEEGQRFKRPDLIDIKVNDKGKMEIYAMVEVTRNTLDHRKYHQLIDFKDDFIDFLANIDTSELVKRGYTNMATELKNISVAEDMKTIIYIGAERDPSKIYTYADSEGLDNNQWDEFEAILTEDCDIRRCAFSTDEVDKMLNALSHLLK